MNAVFQNSRINSLKRDLILRFVLLLALFMLLLAISYNFSTKAISAKEYDSVLINFAGRQRMLIYQYISEINQVLVGFAFSDYKMISEGKSRADSTAKLFKKTHNAFLKGGDIPANKEDGENGEDVFYYIGGGESFIIPAIQNKTIRTHLKHVHTQWQELEKVALLSLSLNTDSTLNKKNVQLLLDKTITAVVEMDHVVQLMQHDSETKLRKLGAILLAVIVIASVLFFSIIYFVYSKIVLPLDCSLTALQHASEKLEEEKIRAEEANNSKSEFLSRMSHELRTPMNAILGFAQLLEMNSEQFNEDQNNNIEEIICAGQHLLCLINEVLDLAKIESGTLTVTVDKVSMDDVLKQCISLITAQAEERHIKLVDQVSGKHHIVIADFIRLKQVLLNLLSNAIKYNCKHGRITLLSEITDNHRLCISVIDTGRGLSKDDMKKLFNSFVRLNTLDSVEGTGIGLVISKHLIEVMGGGIGVESVPGVGTTFWIEIPLAQ